MAGTYLSKRGNSLNKETTYRAKFVLFVTKDEDL